MDTLLNREIKGYAIREQVGSGGFGAVYRAVQPSVGREVAIKVILPQYANEPEFVRRFEVEAQIIARLEHPHIVPLYDFWRDPDGAYLVMRWLPDSLRSALERHPWTLDTTARLLEQIAGALTVAHREGIVHRDIKPDNILLDEDENAYLADFGIAKNLHMRSATSQSHLEIAGSPAYLSPEQIRSEEITERADLYSLGYVLYELLTGEKPFRDAKTPGDYIMKHLSDPMPMLSIQHTHIPAAIDEVLQTVTAKDPSHRYANALRFAAAFRAALPTRLPRMVSQPLADPLTERELEVLGLMIEGLDNNEIAQRLFLTPGTVKWYIKQVYSKLDAHSRQQAVERALSLKLNEAHAIPPPGPVLLDQAAVQGVESVLRLVEPENPYKGLRAFQEHDAADFFGRAALTERLLSRMVDGGDSARLLTVVGPSGSGKSSVVRAGLIPALRKGALTVSPHPFIVDFLPGTHPLEELEAALLRVAVNPMPGLLEQLQTDRRGLVRAAKRLLPNDYETELILVVDQFEELFTLVADEAPRVHFIDNLLSAATDPRGRVRVILTLRADFYDRPLLYPRLAELVRANTEVVIPLTAREMEQAITAPLERVGMSAENGLVATILHDIGEQPGTLPLLQYTLTELFERREGLTLTLDAYKATGRVSGALARRAEDIYNSLDDDAQALTRQLFLRMVTLGEGMEDTRRRVLLTEFTTLASEAALEDVLDSFAQYRLLTMDRDPLTRGPTVEIAHEALIREWSRMREWLNDSREEIRLQRQLLSTTAEWNNAKRDASFLLRGTRLEVFEKWQQDTTLELTVQERTFLETSLAQRTREAEEEKRRQAHELQLAREAAASAGQAAVAAEQAAQMQKRSANIFRVLVGVFLVAALGGFGLSAYAFQQRDQAQRSAEVNQSLVWANSAEAVNETGFPELGLLLALQAVHIPDPPMEAERILRSVATGPGSVAVFRGHSSPVQTAAFTLDGHYTLSGACARMEADACTGSEIVLWDLQTQSEWLRFSGHRGQITSTVFSVDGLRVWSAASDGSLIVWDVDPESAARGTLLQEYPLELGGINEITFSPDGSTLLVATESGTTILFAVQTGSILRRFEQPNNAVTATTFSADGQTMLTGYADGSILLWDVNTGAQLKSFEGHTGLITQVAFHPDGQTFMSSSRDFSLYWWDLTTASVLREYANIAEIYHFVLYPDGHSIVIDNRTVLSLIDIDQWLITGELQTNPDALSFDVNHAVISALVGDSSGQFVLTGLADGSLTLWSLGERHELSRFSEGAPPDGYGGIALSPNGHWLLTGTTTTREAYLWNIDPASSDYRTVQARLTDFPAGVIFPMIFSPNGRYALIGSGDWFSDSGIRSLTLWDVDPDSPTFATVLRTFDGFNYYPRAMRFTPDGNRMLLGTQDLVGHGELMMWDVVSGSLLHYFETGRDISAILITSDNRRALTASAYFSDIVEWDIDPDSPTFGTEVRRIPTNGIVFDLAWGPHQDTFFVALGGRGQPEIDYETGTVVREFHGARASGANLSVALSPDERYLAMGTDVGEVVLWDYVTGTELWRSERNNLQVGYLFFRPDSQTVFSHTIPGTPIEWRIDEPSLDELLQWIPEHRYLRQFTCEERAQYNVPPLCEG